MKPIKLLLFWQGLLGLIFFAFSFNTFAVTVLKQIQVTHQNQIQLVFDSKLTKDQIQIEFFNDIIQVNLSNISVYPAKISSVSGGDIVKIFAYQYTPKLVRCRLTVKGKAENYKDKLRTQLSGKVLSVDLVGEKAQSDRLMAQTAQENQALLETVLGSEPKLEKPLNPPSASPIIVKNQEEVKKEVTEKNRSFFVVYQTFLKLFLVAFGLIFLLVGSLFIMRKTHGNQRFFSSLGQFVRGKLGQKEKLVQLISNHYLGPKKSIIVVKILGRVLVLGVTDESINLIAELSREPGEEEWERLEGVSHLQLDKKDLSIGAGAEAAGPAIFREMLKSERSKPSRAGSENVTRVREQIKSRLEGFKPL